MGPFGPTSPMGPHHHLATEPLRSVRGPPLSTARGLRAPGQAACPLGDGDGAHVVLDRGDEWVETAYSV